MAAEQRIQPKYVPTADHSSFLTYVLIVQVNSQVLFVLLVAPDMMLRRMCVPSAIGNIIRRPVLTVVISRGLTEVLNTDTENHLSWIQMLITE